MAKKKSDAKCDIKNQEGEECYGEYDIVILGCGPAGQKAALAAAKYGKKVGIIEPLFLGGNCTHFGTLPSKTFREAALHLTNHRLRFLDSTFKRSPTMADLITRVQWVINNEVKVIERQLGTNGVDTLAGYGKFKNKDTIETFDENGELLCTYKFKKAIVCCGSTPFLPPNIKFDNKKIFSSDSILSMKKLPKSLTIVGGGIIGCEYASIFSILGVKVNLVEKRPEILALIDREMRANLVHQLDTRKVNFFLGDELEKVSVNRNGKVEMALSSGKTIRSETALICIFRVVNTEKLGLDKVKVNVTPRGIIDTNEKYQTSNPNVYAAGDVVGAPSLASTSFEQGRIAGSFASGVPCTPMSENLPIGIYTIPEISYIGPTELELTKQKIPYQVGKSFFKDTSKGAIIGALDGVLKLMFHQKTRKILAVHVIGENATELVHVGQAVMEHDGTVDYFLDKVFNYPTLAETYKSAALSGLNRYNDV